MSMPGANSANRIFRVCRVCGRFDLNADTPTVFRSELSAIFVPAAPRSLEHILAAASILA
jgi:hypothetical protein